MLLIAAHMRVFLRRQLDWRRAESATRVVRHLDGEADGRTHDAGAKQYDQTNIYVNG